MSIRVYQGTITPEKLKVRLNPGSNGPFAVIELDEHGRSYIAIDTTAVADELIAVVCEAKRLLTCPATAEHSGRACTLPAGHEGHHRSGMVVWGPGVIGCTAVSGTGTTCTGPHEAHPLPHRDVNGFEWPAGEDEECGYPYSIDGTVRYCIRPPGDDHVHADRDGNVLPLENHGEDEDSAPHHATPRGEPTCGTADSRSGYVCTAQAGHDGPDHIAYGLDGEVCRSWPATEEPFASAPRLPRLADLAQDGEDDFAELPAGKTLQDLLSLADAHVPLSAIREWNAGQFRAARDWAVAEHLHASDNDDVARLPKPAHVTSAEQPEASRM